MNSHGYKLNFRTLLDFVHKQISYKPIRLDYDEYQQRLARKLVLIAWLFCLLVMRTSRNFCSKIKRREKKENNLES